MRTDEKRIAQWDEFKAWLDVSGPFDVVIDAANVGYFNQNFDGYAVGFLARCHTACPT